jgi:cleavage and polyadenylation specificity factor subunit 2
VPLEGNELENFYAIEREEKERKAAEAAFAAFEKARRETGGDFSGDSIVDDAAMGGDDDQNLSELLERQIDDAAAFRNIFWVDYRNDWLVRSNPNDPITHLLKSPELLSNYYLNVGTAKNRFQSFPVREISKTVNEYGEVVTATEFERPEVIPKISKTVTASDEKKSTTKKKKEESSGSSIPFKWTCQIVPVNVKCSKKIIQGFTGLSDGRSLKTIISRINPRKLLIVGGSNDATGFLLNHYRMSSEGIEAHAPKVHESINASSSLNLLSAIISEALLNQLSVSYSHDYEVTYLNAKVKHRNLTDTESSEMQEDIDVDVAVSTTYELVPASLSMVPPGPSTIIGDIKLSELRRLLSISHASIKSEFTSSGDLICNGKVLVKKDQSSGELYIEGPLCKEYYQIRNIFYKSVITV